MAAGKIVPVKTVYVIGDMPPFVVSVKPKALYRYRVYRLTSKRFKKIEELSRQKADVRKIITGNAGSGGSAIRASAKALLSALVKRQKGLLLGAPIFSLTAGSYRAFDAVKPSDIPKLNKVRMRKIFAK